MKVDIYVNERNGDRSIRFPWLPEEINYESGGTIRATYDIMDRGPVEVQTGSGLWKYSWESVFPGEYRTDDSMMHGKWYPPQSYHNILEEWKTKRTPLHIMVTGFPINKDVILDDYKGKATGAFGDMEYEIKFIEDRDITIETSGTETKAKRQEDESKKTTYPVAKGDNLWKIAQSKLGKGSRWSEIYNLNKDIIETTAKKHGYKSSNNGHWIFPGTVLSLPQ